MKKTLSKLALISSSVLFATSTFADITASSTARWDATAVKDTTSAIVVTPLKSLSFQYAEGLEVFNSQTGAFDVTVQGQSGATDFELTSKIITNTLTRSGDTSTLDVGIAWNGEKLTKEDNLVLIDTANNINAGLEALSQNPAYTGTGRSSAQGNFVFSIESATSDGSTDADFSALPDGVWDGEVAVQFTATWVGV